MKRGIKGVKYESHADHIRVEMRRHEALKLRLAGMTLRQIAVQQGVSHVTVADDIRKLLKEMPEEDRLQLRKIKQEEYSVIKTRHYTGMLNHEPHSTRVYMDVLAAERRMFGLDSPETLSVDVTNNDVVPVDDLPLEQRKQLLASIRVGEILSDERPAHDPSPKKYGSPESKVVSRIIRKLKQKTSVEE